MSKVGCFRLWWFYCQWMRGHFSIHIGKRFGKVDRFISFRDVRKTGLKFSERYGFKKYTKIGPYVIRVGVNRND